MWAKLHWIIRKTKFSILVTHGANCCVESSWSTHAICVVRTHKSVGEILLNVTIYALFFTRHDKWKQTHPLFFAFPVEKVYGLVLHLFLSRSNSPGNTGGWLRLQNQSGCLAGGWVPGRKVGKARKNYRKRLWRICTGFIRDHTVRFSWNQFEFLPSFMEGEGQIHP